jgi:hypothetical protein
MKTLTIGTLCLVVLAGAGFVAYRLGFLERFTGTATSGKPAGTIATASVPSPGDATGNSASAATGAPVAATSDTTLPSTASDAAPSATTSGAAEPIVAAGAAPSPATAGAAPQAAGTPIPPGLVAIAQPGQSISNRAIELRVTNLRTAPAIGRETASEGREFVIVDTVWKSLIPPQKVNRKKTQDRTAGMGSLGFGGGATSKDKADDEANTTIEQVPFAVGPLPQHLWLVADGRVTEAIAVNASQAIDGHLPTGTLTIPGFEQVVSGGIAFEAPANAQALSLLFLDSLNGHLLLPIKGAPPVLASSLGGSGRSNDLVDLAVTGTSWSEAPSSVPGAKTLIVGVRGISRQNAIVQIPFGDFGFLQTDQGCVAQPEVRARQITRPMAPMGRFPPFVPSEGQLAFTVPADTQGATLLVRLRQGGPIDLPGLGDGSARKPPALVTHEDGKVLRVHIVGTGTPPAGLRGPREGFEHFVVYYMVENLKTGSGLELQPAPQFALADDQGTKYPPDRASQQLPCRLTGANVVPAGGWRRFSLLYVVPAGQPLSLQYRGFESTGSLKVR